MSLAGRLLTAIAVLTVATLLVVGLSLREAWRGAEEARFDAQLQGAVERVSRDVEGQLRDLPALVAPLCAHDPVLDAALVDLQSGNLDGGRRLALSLRVPELARALRLDELVLFAKGGEILGAFPDTGSVGARDAARFARLSSDAHVARLRADRDPVALEAHCTRTVSGVSLSLYAARHLASVLETAGLAQGLTLSLAPPREDGAMLARKVLLPEALHGLEVHAARSRTPLLESLERLDRTVLVVGVVTLVLSFLVAILLARGLARPIVELSAQAGRVVDGEPVPVEGRGGRELEELARAFNQAIADLVSLRKRLAVTERIAARREIARRVAHEIKNPLAPIRAAVETLRRLRERSDPAFDEYFEEATRTVLDEVRRITDIVGEFTRFARLPAPRPAPMDLVKAAEDVARLHAAASVPVEVRAEPTPEIVADRDQIVQALTNLVLNAVDAVKSSTAPRVQVSVAPAGPGWVRLSVSDNGPGVPESVRERLFEPYVTTKPEGTGLGLAIVQRIVFEHGGEIVYRGGHAGAGTTRSPAPSGGAEFEIRLPLAGPTLLAEPPEDPSSER